MTAIHWIILVGMYWLIWCMHIWEKQDKRDHEARMKQLAKSLDEYRRENKASPVADDA